MSFPYQRGNLQSEIRSRFRNLLENELAKRDLALDQQVEREFGKLLESGVTAFSRRAEQDIKLHGQTREQFWARELELTEEKLTKIIDQMADQAIKAGRSEIDSETFQQIMKGACPLWPFC